jgi:serine phosphatase RsbU (regulator of sigma subunit)
MISSEIKGPMRATRASDARRTVWILILALSPAAYFGAAELERRLPHRDPGETIERERGIAIAREYARGLGLDAHDWLTSLNVEDSDSAKALLQRGRPAGLEYVTAAQQVTVRLSGGANKWLAVHMTPRGRVVGFDLAKPDRGGRSAIPEDGARAIAEQYLRNALGPDAPFELQPAEAKQTDRTGWQRQFAWESPLPGANATARFHIDVTGDRVTSDSRSVKLLDAAGAPVKSSTPPWKVAYIAVLAIFYVGFAVYAIVRYVRRSIEKEISHRRTLLVTFGFLIAGVILVGLSDGLNFSTDSDMSSDARTAFIWASVALTFCIMGLFFGVAYGAGEGDLREAYPGKIVSLDAVLSGKLFSANFARSLLMGVAAAGWFLLLENALLLALRAPALGGGGAIAGNVRYPLLSLFGDRFTDIAMVVCYGLMLPLTLLLRRVRKQWLVYLLLYVLCAIGSRAAVPDAPAHIKTALQFLFAGATVVPFFLADLAAAICSLTALVVVGELVRRSITSPEWHVAAYHHLLPIAIVFLLVELYCARRGRVYEEAEVRPLYARHLALRQALAAEIGAARTAQRRLLPDAPPRVAGLTIAGSCTPARDVGGDFFDYYALDDHRLGVFLAEGGNRELGSAMTIALAKGFLMYTARLELSPVEILRRLRATLTSVGGAENAPMSVIYAVIDGHNGSVRYARSGSSPRLLLNGNAPAEEVAAESGEIHHGAALLAPSDALVFFTDGLSRQTAERARKSAEQVIGEVRLRHAGAPADELHEALLESALQRKHEAPVDDVTAVVVCRQARAAEVLEGIA